MVARQQESCRGLQVEGMAENMWQCCWLCLCYFCCQQCCSCSLFCKMFTLTSLIEPLCPKIKGRREHHTSPPLGIYAWHTPACYFGCFRGCLLSWVSQWRFYNPLVQGEQHISAATSKQAASNKQHAHKKSLWGHRGLKLASKWLKMTAEQMCIT